MKKNKSEKQALGLEMSMESNGMGCEHEKNRRVWDENTIPVLQLWHVCFLLPSGTIFTQCLNLQLPARIYLLHIEKSVFTCHSFENINCLKQVHYYIQHIIYNSNVIHNMKGYLLLANGYRKSYLSRFSGQI